ncbi:MAG TPA: histidine kinase [Acidimicrobiales bacterium]|nr:histidine kinase [Acidimicrobiales bacterium]
MPSDGITLSRGVPVDAAPPARTIRAQRAGSVVASVAAAVCGVVAIALAGTSGTASEYVGAGVIICWALCGAWAARDAELAPLGAIVGGGSLAAGIAAVSAAQLAHRTGSTDLADVGVRVGAMVAVGAALHLLLAQPAGRLESTGRRAAAATGYAVSVAVGLALLAERDRVLVAPIVASAVLATVIGLAAGYPRYARANAVDRRRLQWLGWAFAVTAEVLLVTVGFRLLADRPRHPLAITGAASAVVPIALVAGAHRRLLGRIDRVLAATVALAGNTALVFGVYIVVVIGLGRRPEGGERSLLLLSMTAAAVVASLYPGTRDRLADVANRLIYGERTAPDVALRTFGTRMSRAIPLDELLLQLAESLRRSLLLRASEVWTGTDGHLELAAGVPHRETPPIRLRDSAVPVVARAGVAGGTWLEVWMPELVADRDSGLLRVAPIVHGGQLLGLIVLERRSGTDALSETDEQVVGELARQVGLALHNVQLDSALQASLDALQQKADELQESRARIVAAGDSERRKLERNLHDGAQQHLVSIAVKVRLARDAVESDPNDALAILGELTSDVQEAVQELRNLAHGIFPPLLMSGGLRDALPHAGSRASLPTDVVVEVGRYPTEVEAAVYFCCLEALQNAAKHAGPDASATVRVWSADHALSFEVADDGAGFDPASGAGSGHGFVNMADRLGAINGTLEVDAAPGAGVRIRGRIPVAPTA